jgi:hypothetical protein
VLGALVLDIDDTVCESVDLGEGCRVDVDIVVPSTVETGAPHEIHG